MLPIPYLLSRNKELAEVLKYTRHWINYTLAAVIAGAAIKHHFHDRDDVLQRTLG